MQTGILALWHGRYLENDTECPNAHRLIVFRLNLNLWIISLSISFLPV